MAEFLEELTQTPQGTPLFIRSITPQEPKALMLLLHGLGEHSGRYLHVMQYFAERQTAVFAPDYRGHGKTAKLPGYLDSVDGVLSDLSHLLDTLRLQFPDIPFVLLGHSLGGMLSILLLLSRQEDFRAAVLSGAGVALPEDIPPLMLKAAGFLSKVAPRLPVQQFDFDNVCSDPSVIEETKRDPLFYRGKVRARTGSEILKGIERAREAVSSITLPLLILHGAEDRTVPPSASEFIYGNSSSSEKKLELIPGFAHEILNEPQKDRVLHEIDSWIEARLQSGSSGRNGIYSEQEDNSPT